MSWEHATVEGAITRHTVDAAALLDALSVPDDLAMYRAPAPERPFLAEVGRESERLRIGLLTEAPTGMPVDAECVAAAEHTARLLESLGHVVEPVKPQFFTPEAIEGYAITILDAALWSAPFDDRTTVEPHLQHRMARAARRHSGEYTEAAARLQVESRQIVAQWGSDFDVLLSPTMACLPPPVGSVLDEANARPDDVRVTETQMISFTAFCNVTGLPAITVPTYTSSTGLPIGSQLVAGPFAEAVLIRLTSALEALADWTGRVPPGFA